MKKIVGDEKTYFNPVTDLTPEHFEVWYTTDPLTVYEEETEDGYRYSMRGCMIADDLTAEKLAQYFDPIPEE